MKTFREASRAQVAKITGIGLVLILLISLPWLDTSVGVLLPGPVSNPASLRLLALVLIAGAAAMTLDVMFGYAGQVSFGHGLFFGLGAYSAVILTNAAHIGFSVAILLTLLLTLATALVVISVALRTSEIGYSMVTLAFAQVAAIMVERNYLGSGGETGVTYNIDVLPSFLVGIANSRNVYWLSLSLVVFIYIICRFAVSTQTGHVWEAIRENSLRTQVIGYPINRYRLAVGVLGCTLAGLCGMTYSIVLNGADPSIVALSYSLALVLMVVLGGRGVLWGAILGGALYTYLNLRLSVITSSETIGKLPDWLAIPLKQPQFLLGVVFVAIVLFVPGGLASLLTRSANRRPRMARWRTRLSIITRRSQQDPTSS